MTVYCSIHLTMRQLAPLLDSLATVCRVIQRLGPLLAMEPARASAGLADRLWIVDGTLVLVRDRTVGASLGLVLNATFGWSWAAPIAALVNAAVAVKGGRDAWQGKGCCAPTAATTPFGGVDAADACGCRPGCDCCS